MPAVAYSDRWYTSNSGGGAISVSVNVPTGLSNRLMIIDLGAMLWVTPGFWATVNGVPATIYDERESGCRLGTFYFVNPPEGAYAVVADVPANEEYKALGVRLYYNVDPGNPWAGAKVTYLSGSSSHAHMTGIPGITDGMGVSSYGTYGASAHTQDSGESERFDFAVNQIRISGADEPRGDDLTFHMHATITASREFLGSARCLRPSAAGSTSVFLIGIKRFYDDLWLGTIPRKDLERRWREIWRGIPDQVRDKNQKASGGKPRGQHESRVWV